MVTVVSVELVVLNETVNSPSVDGSAAAATVAAIDTDNVSLSTIVPMAVSVSITSGFTASILTVNVSLPSTMVSLVIGTKKVLCSPSLPVKVTVPPVLS